MKTDWNDNVNVCCHLHFADSTIPHLILILEVQPGLYQVLGVGHVFLGLRRRTTPVLLVTQIAFRDDMIMMMNMSQRSVHHEKREEETSAPFPCTVRRTCRHDQREILIISDSREQTNDSQVREVRPKRRFFIIGRSNEFCEEEMCQRRICTVLLHALSFILLTQKCRAIVSRMHVGTEFNHLNNLQV
jgi:hypothetical protein